jgi:alginate O-acetyltransferase complex protein AlgI
VLFNTGQYGLFFLVVFVVHWTLPRGWRRPFLLLASYYFYASAIPQYLPLILGLTAFGDAMGRWLAVAQGRTRRVALWTAIIGNLGSLAHISHPDLALLGIVSSCSNAHSIRVCSSRK